MDWDKAKNFTILFLFSLNIFLVFLVRINSADYSITQEQEKAVIEVLSANKINLYTDMPKKFEPMEILMMTPTDYDTSVFESVFFGEDESVERTSEGDKIIFKNEVGTTLSFEGDRVSVENYVSAYETVTSKDQVVEICQEFVDENKDIFPGFVLDNKPIEIDDGYLIEFRQEYKGNIIYSNSAVFTLSKDGKMNIEYSYKSPEKFDNRPLEILAPDEALFAFMQQMLNLYDDKEIFINRIDVVYYQNSEDSEINKALEKSSETNKDANKLEDDILESAFPYYRFYYSDDTSNRYKPIMVNVFTGEIES